MTDTTSTTTPLSPLPSPLPLLKPLGAHAGKPGIPISRPVFLIGSRHNAHLHLLSRQVSKAHALILNERQTIYIRDLASRTHVYVNGEAIREAWLHDGDLIKIGSFTFQLKLPEGWPEPSRSPLPPGKLDVDEAPLPIPLEERVILIGRRPTSNVPLLEPSASTEHAVLMAMNGKWYIRDLGSRTGTFINGKQIHQQSLAPGDSIRIGETDMHFEPTAISAASAVEDLDQLLTADRSAAGADAPARSGDDMWGSGVGTPPLSMPTDEAAPSIESPHKTSHTTEELDAAVEEALRGEVTGDEGGDTGEKAIEETGAAAEAARVIEETPPKDRPHSADVTPSEPVEEIDLARDLDADNNDTHPLPLAPPSPPRPAPSLSSRVIESPVDESTTDQTPLVERAHDADQDDIDTLAEEALADVDETAPPPIHIEQEPEVGELTPRRGWRSRLAAEDKKAPEPSEPLHVAPPSTPAEAAPSTSEVEEPPSIAPVIDEAATVEPPADDMPAAEAPTDDAAPATPLSFEVDTAADESIVETVDEAPPAVPVIDEPVSIEPVVEPDVEDEGEPAVTDEVEPVVTDEEDEQVSGAVLDAAPDIEEAPEAPDSVDEALAADETKSADEASLPLADEAEEPRKIFGVKEPSAAGFPLAQPVADEAIAPADAEPHVDELSLDDADMPLLELGAADADQIPDLREDSFTGADDLDFSNLKFDLSEPAREGGPVDQAIPSEAAGSLEGVDDGLELIDLAEKGDAADAPSDKSAIDPGQTSDSEPQAGAQDAPVVPATTEEVVPPAEARKAKKKREHSSRKGHRRGPDGKFLPRTVAQEADAPIEDGGESSSSAELMEQTEPTPESALPELEALTDLPPDPSAAAVADSLSDTSFGRQLVELEGDALEPIVESDAVVEEVPVEPVEAFDPERALESLPSDEATSAEHEDSPHAHAAEPLFDLVEEASVEHAAEDAEDAEKALEFGRDRVPVAQDDEDEAREQGDAASASVGEASEADEAMAAGVEGRDELDLDGDDAASSPTALELTDKTEPPATPKPARPSMFGMGANQDGYFGGLPLTLNDAGSGRAPQTTPAGPNDQPAASAVAPAAEQEQPPAARSTAVGDAARKHPSIPTPPPKATSRPRHPFAAQAPGEFGAAPEIPPFNGSGPASAGATMSAFDGLAMPARDIDVFSQMPVAPIPDADFAGGGSASAGAFVPPSAPPQRRNQAAASDDEHDDPDANWPASSPTPARKSGGGGQRPPVMPPPPARRKKRRWFGVPLLLVLMLLCMAIAAVGIWVFVPVQSLVQGMMPYSAGTAALTDAQKKEQQTLLASGAVREAATQLVEREGTSPGFLNDQLAYAVAVSNIGWTPEGMTLTRRSNNMTADRTRVKAMLSALYQSPDNQARQDQLNNLRHQVEDLKAREADARESLRQLTRQIETMQASLPPLAGPEMIAELKAQEATHKADWESALKNVQEARAALDQLSFATLAGPATQPAFPEDAHLLEMRAQLAALTNRLNDAKASGNAQATQARADLDKALTQFKRQVADLHALAQDKPELKAYIAAAEQLQETTRALTTDLIQNQQDAQSQISELKHRLDEKIEARRNELLQQDKPLQALVNQLEMDKRLYNAGLAGEEKSDRLTQLVAEMEKLKGQIADRQAQIGKDAIYSDTIKELQQFIDAGKKRLADTRKRTDETLVTLQQSLAQAQSGLSNLPREQKELAEKLETRIAELNAARKKYASAVETQSDSSVSSGEASDDDGLVLASTSTVGDSEVRVLEKQVASLQNEIGDYQREAAAIARKSLTGKQEKELQEARSKKQAALQAAQDDEDKARTAYMSSWQKLRETELKIADAQKFRQDLSARESDAKKAQAAITAAAAARGDAQTKLDALSVPMPPHEINAIQVEDPRQTYIAISVGGIAVVFTFLILLTFVTGSGTTAAYEAAGVPDEPSLEEPAQPASSEGGLDADHARSIASVSPDGASAVDPSAGETESFKPSGTKADESISQPAAY